VPRWASRPKEQFRILFLDKRNQIIADEVQQTGTVDPRTGLCSRSGESGRSICQSTGHRAGAQSPFRRFHAVARRYRDDQADRAAAKPLGVIVHDQIIVGKQGHASFRGLGLI
jgi:DNA repair protein RadC